ncbi:hypothetical protein [Gordonia sp. FQ]|uniref:hypothetical protein n=1 Tax=Gordonia sp. FQ TaxID=3446634 RepID=UPI003F8477FF
MIAETILSKYFESMVTHAVSFSELQNRGKAALDSWLGEGGRPLRVTRRDAEDLVLVTAARAEQEHDVVSAAVAVLRAVAGRPGGAELLRGVVVAAFPWAKLLSEPEIEEFGIELTDALEVSESLNNPALAAQAIAAWRHTAEVYSDPALATALRAPTHDDVGPVPAPAL